MSVIGEDRLITSGVRTYGMLSMGLLGTREIRQASFKDRV
ncbi:hypothetical protein DSOL_4289 [Desulfosporosinus metallidurans]|uniref:Uncharacterized protein n=1 Tax=Desulfosporosinus metallidurans TaxID=1888891 RepID=A0A1Q8QKR7_9FIRM|nr:hypothetical protein DSOL_4289 [Desulfosporosinus metallidurans]